MGNTTVAINTGGLAGYQQFAMHKDAGSFLLVEIHIGLIMAVAALKGVVFIESLPFSLCHRQTVMCEFFGSINFSGNLAPDFLAGGDFADYFISPFMGDVAIGANRPDAGTIAVVDTVGIVGVDVILHLMAANTKFFGIGDFHSPVKAAPEHYAGDKEKTTDNTECHRAGPA